MEDMDIEHLEKGQDYEMKLLAYPCCTSSRTDFLQECLNHHVTEALQSLIYNQVHKDCYGCRVNHPSQVQHVLCLYTNTEEWTELYIQKAIQRLDVFKVMEKWYPELVTLTDSEKGDACRLWIQFKEELTQNQFIDQWISVWAERVNRNWHYGDE